MSKESDSLLSSLLISKLSISARSQWMHVVRLLPELNSQFYPNDLELATDKYGREKLNQICRPGIKQCLRFVPTSRPGDQIRLASWKRKNMTWLNWSWAFLNPAEPKSCETFLIQLLHKSNRKRPQQSFAHHVDPCGTGRSGNLFQGSLANDGERWNCSMCQAGSQGPVEMK